jgi:hypothetical protein
MGRDGISSMGGPDRRTGNSCPSFYNSSAHWRIGHDFIGDDNHGDQQSYGLGNVSQMDGSWPVRKNTDNSDASSKTS